MTDHIAITKYRTAYLNRIMCLWKRHYRYFGTDDSSYVRA